MANLNDPRTPSAADLDWQNIDITALNPLLASRQGIDVIVQLRGRDAVSVIDLLDQVPPSILLCSILDSRMNLGAGSS